jgi:hypothetical protein
VNTPYVTAPAHVAACDLGDDTATVLVNYRSGGVHTLIGPSARWWAELAATGDLFRTTTLTAADTARLVGQLRAAGLLIGSPEPRPWAAPVAGQPWRLSFGTQELQAGRTALPPVAPHVLSSAAVAVAVTLAARHLGAQRSSMARVLRLLAWALGRCRRPATAEQAAQAVHAIRRVGALLPGRVACLEESAAAVMLLAASRLRVDWCHGVAADPIRLHAWVETDHGPVAEPASTARYTPIRMIPDRNQGRA